MNSNIKRIIVGLDFGTHSTKCVLSEHGSNNDFIICFTQSAQEKDYPFFTEPSLVRVANKRMYFGRSALKVTSGILYRSLKMQILHKTLDDANYPEFPPTVSPDLLIACYLSRVIRLIKKCIENVYGSKNTKIFLNMAAPMDHFKNEVLKTRYLQIINAAWESVFGNDKFIVKNGMCMDTAVDYFKHRILEKPTGIEERMYDVLPETVAPIVSLSLDPRMAPGFYLMVDVGAGTSEFSINLVNERGADQKIVCYFDQTRQIGGDKFEIAEQSDGDNHNNIEVSKLVKQIVKYVTETCWQGYDKDRKSKSMRTKWKRIYLLLTGGAARREAIESAIRNILPIEPHVPGEEKYVVSWHEPSLEIKNVNLNSNELSLLAVSHGLSIHRIKWPEIFDPESVENLDGDLITEKPGSYWYVDS